MTHPAHLPPSQRGAALMEALWKVALADGVRDAYPLQQVVRRTVGQWVSKQHRRRPMIVPVVIEA